MFGGNLKEEVDGSAGTVGKVVSIQLFTAEKIRGAPKYQHWIDIKKFRRVLLFLKTKLINTINSVIYM